MTHYTKKSLSIVTLIGIGLYSVSYLIPELARFGRLSCIVGLFSGSILLAGYFISRKCPKARKRQPHQPAASGFHNEPALDIMYGLDDGRRHYEKLPPEQRQKSIFGGKNVL